MDLIQCIRNRLKKERLMFVYRGEITNSNSVALLTLLEKEMENAEYGFRARKRLFMFVLENLQNISRHGEQGHKTDMSLVAYSKTDDGYKITTGNIVANRLVKGLKERLERINKLDTEGIRTLYRQILCSSEFSNKGGAGLGLLEMANKTGNRLDFDFVPEDENHSFFILSKTVDDQGLGVHTSGTEMPFNSRSVTLLESFMKENSIYMIWSGHINSDVGGEVLSLTETKFTEENVDAALRRRVFTVLVEILENVAKHSPGAAAEKKYGMPLAMIRFDENAFVLTTGNLILNSRINDLEEKLELMNRHDITGLKDLFISSLSGQTIETDSTGDLGLIEIARKSGERLDYRFEKVNELYSFYTLTVKVEDKQFY